MFMLVNSDRLLTLTHFCNIMKVLKFPEGSPRASPGNFFFVSMYVV